MSICKGFLVLFFLISGLGFFKGRLSHSHFVPEVDLELLSSSDLSFHLSLPGAKTTGVHHLSQLLCLHKSTSAVELMCLCITGSMGLTEVSITQTPDPYSKLKKKKKSAGDNEPALGLAEQISI